jgi:DNA helicase II / ATP-dependent DNA helicase PcrA
MNSTILAQKEIFKEAYQQLNQQQREAVDEIYGPVMVIAGPGTGKTQLLAVRVCNILDKTDADPTNILCLTYTDAGVTAMRNRLTRFMGSDAYKVGIFTYHSFCNLIIRENPEFFSEYRELSNADDLEMVEIMVEILDSIPKDHPHKRLSGEIYFDKNKWQSLFDTMKKEGWSPEYIKSKLEEYKEVFMKEKHVYKVNYKNFKKGDLKINDYNKELNDLSFVEHGVDFIHLYNDLLKKRSRIDYNDSIIYVLNALKNSESLRLRYQEKYQFVLADEYQDTNGTQNDLLFTLVENEYIDQPNIFVVGDDDQSIFRFQGANLNNIIEFKDRFNPQIVVLRNNYRSFQGILDSAKTLIEHNKQRLTYRFPSLDKTLIESRKDNYGIGNSPQLLAYANPVNHDYGVVDLIMKIHARGVPYHEIAVIYQKHKEAEDIIKYLSYEDIPVSIKRRVNILPLKEISRIISLIKYISTEMANPMSMDKMLFEILHYDFWNNHALDLAKLSFYIGRLPKEERESIFWRDVIADESFLRKAGLKNLVSITQTSKILEELFIDYNNQTVQTFFEVLLSKTGIYTSILLDPNKGWRLSVINTFFDFIKRETAANPDATFEDILSKIDKMIEFNIPLQTNNIIYRNNGINFMTAHGSKGLEFEEVIILNTWDKGWKPTTNIQKVKFPDNILLADQDDSDEDYRRLFFVALTRAKNNAYLMYSKTDEKQKEVVIHKFARELGFGGEPNIAALNEDDILDYTLTLLKHEQGQISLIDHHLIDQVTENMVLNVTALNKYLKCPFTFYFENILRVPQARQATTGFGNAIHNALEKFILILNSDPDRKPPTFNKLLDLFYDYMLKYKSHFTPLEYDNHIEEGKKVCQSFYHNYVPEFGIVRTFKTELELNGAVEGVPISGLIDRLDTYDDHIDVIDYKTGRNDSADFTAPNGENTPGKSWRQGIFYQILLEQDQNFKKYPVKSVFQFLKNTDKSERVVKENQDHKDMVKSEIVEVYQKIKSHQFDKGCGEEKCQWCNFVKENGGIN